MNPSPTEQGPAKRCSAWLSLKSLRMNRTLQASKCSKTRFDGSDWDFIFGMAASHKWLVVTSCPVAPMSELFSSTSWFTGCKNPTVQWGWSRRPTKQVSSTYRNQRKRQTFWHFDGSKRSILSDFLMFSTLWVQRLKFIKQKWGDNNTYSWMANSWHKPSQDLGFQLILQAHYSRMWAECCFWTTRSWSWSN